MKPYRTPSPWLPRHYAVLLLLLIGVSVTPWAAAKKQKPALLTKPARTVDYVTSKNDEATRTGFDHYYDLDYPAAIASFERALAQHPGDPFAVNHLLAAVFFQELYRAGAMETSLYANNNFLDNHTQIHIDPATEARIRQLMQQGLELSEARLAENPDAPEAYYARGVTRAIQSSYTAFVQRSWFAALGSAKAARRDHEKALQLDPAYSDARLLVGMHSYIVGSLPWAVRVMAHVVGESGNKTLGLRDLYASANGDGDASLDAKLVLTLLLRREQRYDEALAFEQQLTAAHPRNFLFALEEANILKDKGSGPESIAAYRRVLAAARSGLYHDPHLEFAYCGLGEALRGQKDFAEAAAAYDEVELLSAANPSIRLRSELAAGQMYDLLSQRQLATQKYQAVITANATSQEAAIARKNLREPYR